MSLIKTYLILQDASIIAFTISELFRENQQGAEGGLALPTPHHINTHTHTHTNTHTHTHTQKLEIIKSLPQFSLESAIIVLVLTVLMIIPQHKSSIYQVQ